MPTILRHKGYRFYFYSHPSNAPPHIPLDRDENWAKIWLNSVALAPNIGYNP